MQAGTRDALSCMDRYQPTGPWAPQGGGQEGALAPPPWKFTDMGAPPRII